MSYKTELRDKVIGIRVTEGELQAILEYCSKIDMSSSDVGRRAIIEFISNSGVNLPEEYKEFIEMRKSEMQRSIYRDINDMILQQSKVLKRFEADLKVVISNSPSNIATKRFINNSVTTLLKYPFNISDTKALLTRICEILKKYHMIYLLTRSTKMLTFRKRHSLYMLTYNIDSNQYVIRKTRKIKEKSKLEQIRSSSRYKSRLKDIKKEKKGYPTSKLI